MNRRFWKTIRFLTVIPLGILIGLLVIRTGLIQAYAPAEEAGHELQPDRVVEYAQRGALSLTLHVFLPEGHKKDDSRAAVLFFHGGSWKGGHPSRFYSQCERLAVKGMVAASASYRLMGKGALTPLECAEDARAAFDWMVQNGSQHGIDPTRIAVGGGSAGGHLAACVGLLPAGEGAACPAAMALFNPPLDLLAESWPEEFMDHGRQVLMTVFGDKAMEISPLRFVTGEAPPTIIFHGTKDASVPFTQSEEFARRMKEAGARCDFHPYEGRTHGFYNKSRNEGRDYEETLRLTEEFFASLGLLEGDTD